MYVIPWAIAIILLSIASWFKLVVGIDELLGGDFKLHTLSVVAIAFGEQFLAFLLFTHGDAGAVRRLAARVFGSFALYAFALSVLGVESCSCFGIVVTHPWLMFVIDCLVAGLLFYSAPVVPHDNFQWRLQCLSRTWLWSLTALAAIDLLSLGVIWYLNRLGIM